MKKSQAGFSLISLAVAMVALSIVMLAAMAYWQKSAGIQVAAAQQDAQMQSKDALIGFLYSNHRLPCPAVDVNGFESCTGSVTSLRQIGFVPWRTLGLPRPDTGRLRYAVYREASASAASDRDLAATVDRMNPLRVRTPTPKPQNGNAPNGNAPPLPVAQPTLLGATNSGIDSDPLSASCNAANSPPCPAASLGSSAVNQIDVCLALNTASALTVAPASSLAVKVGATRRAVAFVVVAPGLLDASGNNQKFDGANATATDTTPTFESASAEQTSTYDDKVLAVSHAELFSTLNCAEGLAAASHAHFNAATGAFVLERAMYDYRDQLYVVIKLAEADVAAASAGVLTAVAAGVDSGQAVVSATGDAFASAGARSFQIGLASVGVALAVVGGVAAAAGLALAITSVVDATNDHNDFAARTTAITDLTISINRNALLADAIGF